jgi:hypothetical protein
MSFRDVMSLSLYSMLEAMVTENDVAAEDEKCRRRADAVLRNLLDDEEEEIGGQQLQVPLETQQRGLHLQEHDEGDRCRGAVVVTGLTKGGMVIALKRRR